MVREEQRYVHAFARKHAWYVILLPYENPGAARDDIEV